MAADIEQERRVVHDGAGLLVEPAALGEPQSDQALAQDVLHRLPEPEIHAECQRRHQLSQADMHPIRVLARVGTLSAR